jgi:hypothetical protein
MNNLDRLLAVERLVLEGMEKLQQAHLIINHMKATVKVPVSTPVENDECIE